MDLDQAREILAARHACDSHEPSTRSDGAQGQVIDLFEGREPAAAPPRPPQELPSLDGLGAAALVAAFRAAQESRALTYSAYEAELEALLGDSPPRLAEYPQVVQRASSAFAGASERIRAVEAALLALEGISGAAEVAGLIRALQGKEKEKLQLTAAHHLERIRIRQLEMVEALPSPSPDDGGEEGEPLPEGAGEGASEADFYRGNVATYVRRLAALVETINETLDEIRCWEVDLQPEDE